AFAALLVRHGAMILRVCERVLGPGCDAEDAFQATFLLLVDKAATLRRGDSLGSWLHTAAYRIAARARAQRTRRRELERRARRPPAGTPPPHLSRRQLLARRPQGQRGAPGREPAPPPALSPQR